MFIQAPENTEWLSQFLKRLLTGDILDVIANYIGIIGFIFTIYIAWSISKVRNRYIFRIKAPQFVKVLGKQASILIEYANDFASNQAEIGDEFARIEVRLKAMQGRMTGGSKKAVKDLRKLIKEYEREPANEAKFRLAYRGMHRVIEEVKEYQEDLDLE
jgi:hypothetical protein